MARERKPAIRPSRRERTAFTLIEMLISLFIVAVLLSLLFPALRSVRSQSRAVKCQIHLRNIAFNFQAFASDSIPMNRGDDESDPRLSGGRFRLETFQESQYQIDEFWDRPEARVLQPTEELDVMACPEVSGTVQLRARTPCREGAVTPPRHVSYAMNLRLDRPEVKRDERWHTRTVNLTNSILRHSQLPLVWDTDGQIAGERQITPHYSAPPGEPEAPYGSGQVWFPAMSRHDGLQVGFVSGEVLVSRTPLEKRSWMWTFNP